MPAKGGWNYRLLEKLFQAIPHTARTDTLFDFLVRDNLISSWIFAAAFYLFWSTDDNRTGWRRVRLLQIVYDVIFSGNDGILNRAYLQKIWEQHQKRQFDRSAYLWSVLMFRKWQQVFQA